MKKLLLALAIMSYSQSEAQDRFRSGIKAGYTASTISNLDANYRNGFYAGLFGEFKVSRMYSMQAELLYLQQGATNLHPYLGDDRLPKAFDIERNSLSLNLLNRFSFKRIALFIGPGIDIKISDNKNDLLPYGTPYAYDTPPYEENGSLDLTLNVGAAFKLNPNFTIEGRFRIGAIEPIYPHTANHFSSPNLNQSFLVGLNYTFK